MKKFFRIFLILALCLILCGALFACDKGDEPRQDDPANDDPPPTTTTVEGDKAFETAYTGATKLAERSASILSKQEYTAGIRLDLDINGTAYALLIDANVNGTDAAANEFAIELYKNQSLRLGGYLFGRMLYVYDGVKYRFLDMFSTEEAPTVGADLAGAFGKLAGIVKNYQPGSVTEAMKTASEKNLVLTLLKMVLAGQQATLSADGLQFELDLPLGHIAATALNLLPTLGIELGFDLASLDGLLKSVLGVSYTELESGEFDIDANKDKLASLKLSFTVGETGELEKLNVGYKLNDTVIDLKISDIVMQEGRRDIIPDALNQATAGAFRLTGESWLNGQKIYSELQLQVDTKSNDGIMMMFKAGSQPDADDYIYAIYSGKNAARVRIHKADGSVINGNPTNLKGLFNARISPAFMKIVSPLEFDASMPCPGFQLYSVFDVLEVIDFVKSAITGGTTPTEPPADNPDPPAQPSALTTDDIISLLTGVLGRLSVSSDGLGLAMDKNFIFSLIGAFKANFDPNMDLAATVGDLFNSVSDFLNIETNLPHEIDPNAEGYRPYYTLESFLTNVLGTDVTRGLDLGAFVEAMGLNLTLGADMEDAFGLKIGLELTTTADEIDEESGETVSRTVSAGNSVFTVGFCDKVSPPAAHTNFTIDYYEEGAGNRTDITNGIPAGTELDESGNPAYYAIVYLNMSPGSPVSSQTSVIGIATLLFNMLSAYALFG